MVKVLVRCHPPDIPVRTNPPRKRYRVRLKMRKGAIQHPNFGELEVLTRALGELWAVVDGQEADLVSPSWNSPGVATTDKEKQP